MKLKFLLAACVLLSSGPALHAVDKRYIDLPELAAPPASNDWLSLWDTSLGDVVRISRANFLSGAPLSGDNVTSGTVADARLSGNVTKMGSIIELTELEQIPTASLLGRHSAGTGVVQRFGVSSHFDLSDGSLSLAFQPMIFDTKIDQLRTGEINYQLGLNAGYSLDGPAVRKLPSMIGTTVDLTMAGETLVVTGNVTLTIPPSAMDGQEYILHLVGDGVNTWNVTTPSLFSTQDEAPLTLIKVNPASSLYLPIRWAGSRWEILSNPAETVGTGPLVLRDGATLVNPSITGSVGWADGARQTMNPSSTRAGFNFGPIAGNPTVDLVDGDAWYNTTTNKAMVRENGVSVAITDGTGGLGTTDINTSAKVRAIVSDASGTDKLAFTHNTQFTGAINFADPVTFAALTVAGVLTGANLRITPTTTDQTLGTAGDMGFNSTDEQIGVHSAADGEISGEAALSLIQHKAWTFDPKAVCDGAVDRLFLMTLGDHAVEGIKIVEWKLSFEADPTTELDLDLKYANNFIGVANSAVIDVLDSTAGVASEDTNANINGGAAVANGKVLYLEFGTAYTEANHQVIVELWYYAEED